MNRLTVLKIVFYICIPLFVAMSIVELADHYMGAKTLDEYLSFTAQGIVSMALGFHVVRYDFILRVKNISVFPIAIFAVVVPSGFLMVMGCVNIGDILGDSASSKSTYCVLSLIFSIVAIFLAMGLWKKILFTLVYTGKAIQPLRDDIVKFIKRKVTENPFADQELRDEYTRVLKDFDTHPFIQVVKLKEKLDELKFDARNEAFQEAKDITV